MSNSYELLDAGDFRKLEQVGPYRVIRPCPQAVWRPHLPASEWQRAEGEFCRSTNGNGTWKMRTKLPASWKIQLQGHTILVRLTDFGHLGFFPEHHLHGVIPWAHQHPGKKKVLHLFAYTGTGSVSLAACGMEVVHVDASKTSLAWGKENVELTPVSGAIRWILDDAHKFVLREARRGQLYDGILLDPPSFGRDPTGKVWKIEDHLLPLLEDLKALRSPNFSFFQLTSHSPFYTPVVLENLVQDWWGSSTGIASSFEMTVPESSSGRQLPCGAGAWIRREQ